MGHITVQLSAALVVPIGTVRRKRNGISGWKARFVVPIGTVRRKRNGPSGWKARLLREASAWEAGLPVGNYARWPRMRRLPWLLGDPQRNAPQEGHEA